VLKNTKSSEEIVEFERFLDMAAGLPQFFNSPFDATRAGLILSLKGKMELAPSPQGAMSNL